MFSVVNSNIQLKTRSLLSYLGRSWEVDGRPRLNCHQWARLFLSLYVVILSIFSFVYRLMAAIGPPQFPELMKWQEGRGGKESSPRLSCFHQDGKIFLEASRECCWKVHWPNLGTWPALLGRKMREKVSGIFSLCYGEQTLPEGERGRRMAIEQATQRVCQFIFWGNIPNLKTCDITKVLRAFPVAASSLYFLFWLDSFKWPLRNPIQHEKYFILHETTASRLR